MARHGVTYHDIANAADRLLGQGKQPTIELIRNLLGTGSATTIANHLRNWRLEQDGTVNMAKNANLPPEMVAMMQGLWERLTHLAQDKIIAIETVHQQMMGDLQQELQKYKTNNQRWQHLLQQWKNEKDALMDEQVSLKETVLTLQKNHTVLQAQITADADHLQEKQERIMELNQLHMQAQANLEHYRESVREQRQNEQREAEKQKQEWASEMKILKEQLAQQQEKASTIQQHHQDLKQACALLEKSYSESETRFVKKQEELDRAEKEKIEYQQRCHSWQHQYHETKQALDVTRAMQIEAQAEIKSTVRQISDLKETLHHIEGKVAQLNHEKWSLAQENAMLEGQLKQMRISILEPEL